MLSDTLVTTLVLTSYLGAAGDYAALYQGELEPVYPQSAWVTHPFMDTKEFQLGSVCFDGNVYPSVPLRYNIYDNLLSVVMPDSKLVVVPEQQRVAWFEVDGVRYLRVDDWFMRVCYQGNGLSLLYKQRKVRVHDVEVDRHWMHNLTTVGKYYILLANGTMREVTNLKSLRRLFPEQKELLHQLPKQRKLSFSAKTAGSSLAYCTEHLDHAICAEPKGMEGPTETVYTPISITLLDSDNSTEAVAPVERVAAYYAYQPGSSIQLEYTDDETVIETPGIADLEPIRETRTLDEVEVTGMRQKLAQQLGGVEAFRPSLMRNVPQAMGEADVLKLAMLTPGVSTTGEASSGLNVRGGSSDQNLMLMNGNTVYNPMHLFGLFSAFNPDLIAESELYKGSVPSQYGGRLSSVLNIKGRTADREQFHGSASIGLITSKGVFDIPLVKNRASLLIGGRGTYSDWMLRFLPENKDNEGEEELNSYRNGNAGFWDVGGTLSVSLSNPTNREFSSTLLVNGYYSDDRFALTEYEKYAYSNQNYSAELRNRIGEKLNTSLLFGFDHYDYSNDETLYHFSAARLSFNLNQYFLKAMADYRLNGRQSLNMGFHLQRYHIQPGDYQPLGEDSYITPNTLPDDRAMESALWLEDNWTLTDRLKLTTGLRLNIFAPQTEIGTKSYINPDLRLSASYTLNDFASVKLGMNTMHQYIHKVSNTVIMSPTDTWVLSNDYIKPQSGWQLSGGFYSQLHDRQYEFSAEAYYKGMNNYLTYRSGAILIMNPALYRDVVGTRGQAYGLELQLRKLYGRLNGWVSYTYSRTQLRQDRQEGQLAINRGEWFSADYDVPHNLKVVTNFKFTRRYSTSLNVDYSTGRPFTAPVAQYCDPETSNRIPLYSDRNAVRMPDYCRVDWSFNIEPGHHLTTLTHSWFTIGVYNLLGRKNAYSIFYESTGREIQGYKLSIFGSQIPYVNYNIKF